MSTGPVALVDWLVGKPNVISSTSPSLYPVLMSLSERLAVSSVLRWQLLVLKNMFSFSLFGGFFVQKMIKYQLPIYWKNAYIYIFIYPKDRLPCSLFPLLYTTSEARGYENEEPGFEKNGDKIEQLKHNARVALFRLENENTETDWVKVNPIRLQSHFDILGSCDFEVSSWAWMKFHALSLGPWGCMILYKSCLKQTTNHIFLMFGNKGGKTCRVYI